MKIIIAFLALLSVFLALPAGAQEVKTVDVYAIAGIPVTGTNQIQTLTTGTGVTGGTFTITIAGGRTTNPITWSATNATLVANVDAALEALPQIGTGGVTTAVGTMTAGIGTVTLTMAGKNVRTDFPALTANGAGLTPGTGATVAITITTPGAGGTFRDAKPGTILIDSLTPGLYQNTSATLLSPTWTAITVP